MGIRIPLSSPEITDADIEAVVSVLRTSRLSIGPKQEEFEQAVARHADVPYGVALTSGTAGLHLCLAALGIGEGDEVIVPSFAFVAVANAVLYQRATPVFADIDPVTLNLDPDSVANAVTSRTRAIVIVHTFGCPADLDPLLRLAASRGIKVIEDACEALGAEYRGRKAGGFGDAGLFAFYPNKQITTGEGGVVVTRDLELAETLRALRNQGRRPGDGWLDHKLLGYNYRLSELNCALGLSQLERLDSILEQRANRAALYCDHLRKIADVTCPVLQLSARRISWFTFPVRLAPHHTQEDRDTVARYMVSHGIGCGRYFAPLHWQPLYACYASHALTVTEQVAPRILALPFFNRLTDGEISEVCLTLAEAIAAIRKPLAHAP